MTARRTIRHCSGIVAAAYDRFFGILAEPDEARAAPACSLRALEPGGEVLIPVSEASAASEAVPDWRERRNVRLPDEDAQFVVFGRTAHQDDGRLQRWRLRHEVERAGRQNAVFFREHAVRRYGTGEFSGLLPAAGFESIEVRRGYTGPQPSDPADDLVFSARRRPRR